MILEDSVKDAAVTKVLQLVKEMDMTNIISEERAKVIVQAIADADWTPKNKDIKELLQDIKNDGYYYTMAIYQLIDPAEYYSELYGLDINEIGGIL